MSCSFFTRKFYPFFPPSVFTVFSGVLPCDSLLLMCLNWPSVISTFPFFFFFFGPKWRVCPEEALHSRSLCSGPLKKHPSGDLCLSLTLTRSRATQDAFILAGVALPLRKMTSSEMERGIFLFVCLFYCASCLSILGTYLMKMDVLQPQNDGVRNKNMTWGICFSSQEAIFLPSDCFSVCNLKIRYST